MLQFNKQFFKTGYLLSATAIILILLAFILPVECSFENHFLENLEVLILFSGFLTVLYKAKILTRFKQFYWGCGIFYMIMILRELSWGRVFYPIGKKDNGEELYISIHNIWYGNAIYPLVTMLVLIALFLMIKCYFYCRHRQIIINVPILYLIIFILSMISSQLIFEKELINIFMPYNQLLEEATEAIAYCSLVCFTYNWQFKTNFKKGYFHATFL